MATEVGTAEPTAAGRGSHAPALLGYAALTVAFLWPAVRHFRTRPMLGGGDGTFFYWAWWSMPRSLADGRNPFASDLLFHPVGVDLRLSTLAPLAALATAPVRAALGPVAQVNAAELIAAWLAAVVAYLLMVHVWHHRGAAFVGGAAYSFSAFRFVHAPEHLNLIHTAFLPLGVLLLLRVLERPSRWRGVALGAAVGAAFLTDPQIAVLTTVCLVPVLVHQRERLRPAAGPMLAAAAVALVVAAPLLVPMALAQADGEGPPATSAVVETAFSSDPSLWVAPPVGHPIWGGRIGPLAPRAEGVLYPGLVVVALAMAALVGRPARGRAPWATMAVLGFVLSLGPYLSFWGGFYRVPLPYMLLRDLPVLSAMRVPGRLGLVGVMGLDLLAVGTLVALRRRRALWIAVAGLVLFVELLPAHPPSASFSAPAPYQAIRRAPDDGAVLEIPLQWSTGTTVVGDVAAGRYDSVFLAYATVHEHPLVNGVASRLSTERVGALLAEPVYRQVLALQHDPGFDDRASFTPQDLRALGIGFVVYHRDRPLPEVLRYIEQLGLRVLADDGTVVVWAVG